MSDSFGDVTSAPFNAYLPTISTHIDSLLVGTKSGFRKQLVETCAAYKKLVTLHERCCRKLNEYWRECNAAEQKVPALLKNLDHAEKRCTAISEERDTLLAEARSSAQYIQRLETSLAGGVGGSSLITKNLGLHERVRKLSAELEHEQSARAAAEGRLHEAEENILVLRRALSLREADLGLPFAWSSPDFSMNQDTDSFDTAPMESVLLVLSQRMEESQQLAIQVCCMHT